MAKFCAVSYPKEGGVAQIGELNVSRYNLGWWLQRLFPRRYEVTSWENKNYTLADWEAEVNRAELALAEKEAKAAKKDGESEAGAGESGEPKAKTKSRSKARSKGLSPKQEAGIRRGLEARYKKLAEESVMWNGTYRIGIEPGIYEYALRDFDFSVYRIGSFVRSGGITPLYVLTYKAPTKGHRKRGSEDVSMVFPSLTDEGKPTEYSIHGGAVFASIERNASSFGIIPFGDARYAKFMEWVREAPGIRVGSGGVLVLRPDIGSFQVEPLRLMASTPPELVKSIPYTGKGANKKK